VVKTERKTMKIILLHGLPKWIMQKVSKAPIKKTAKRMGT
jgi:hypothetical protein